MKSFRNFLLENINEIEQSISDFDPNETFIHVNNDGEVVVESTDVDSERVGIQDDNGFDEEDFDMFYSDENQGINLEEAESNKKKDGATWGGETIIDLNFGEKSGEKPKEKETLKEWEFKDDGNAGEEDDTASNLLRTLHRKNKDNIENPKATATLKYLFKLGQRNMDQVKNDGQKYIIVNKDDGSYELQVKDFKEEERHPLSDQEIDEILAAKRGENAPPPKEPAKFEFDAEGNLLKDGKPIQDRFKKKFIQQLHNAAEKIHGRGNVHYRWKATDDGNGWTDKLEVNTTKWDDSDDTNTKRFDTAEYKLVGPEEQQKALDIIQTTVKKAGQKKNIDIGFDRSTRQFTLGGNPMDKDQLRAFVVGLNGGVGNVKKDKMGNIKEPDEYWNHFKISMKGSKVGDIANFSLPPVQTCNKAAPCITDGCYAVKAYGLYPASRVAQDINLALLREGKFDQFVKEVSTAVRSTFKKNVGALKEGEKIQYFRFHVSGDIFSDKYLNAICDIAEANGNVGFWTYTKQYDILLRNMERVLKIKNLSVLVSCWGEFRPRAFGKKYEVLEEKFPLAYLDDGSEEMKNYIDTKDGKGEPFVCPCTDYSEAEVHCNKCLKCYKVSEIMNTNLVFKKH